MISTGIKTQIGIKIFGEDLKTLEDLSAKIGRELENVKGASGVYAEQITGKPYIEFDIDRVAASRFGINTGTINKILQTAVGGMTIGHFYEGEGDTLFECAIKKSCVIVSMNFVKYWYLAL